MSRDDITVLGVPLAKMCNEAFDTARSRTLMKNTTYVGVLAALLEMDMKVIEQLLLDTFGTKTHLIDANKQALEMGHDYAKENFECPLPFKAIASNKTKDHFIIDGKQVTEIMCKTGHAVPYFGGAKADTQKQHMKNRKKLVAEGVVKGAIE